MRIVVIALLLVSSTRAAQAGDPCLFNPATNSYQLCYHLTAGGQCAHFGAACGATGQGIYNPATNATQECAHVTAGV